MGIGSSGGWGGCRPCLGAVRADCSSTKKCAQPPRKFEKSQLHRSLHLQHKHWCDEGSEKWGSEKNVLTFNRISLPPSLPPSLSSFLQQMLSPTRDCPKFWGHSSEQNKPRFPAPPGLTFQKETENTGWVYSCEYVKQTLFLYYVLIIVLFSIQMTARLLLYHPVGVISKVQSMSGGGRCCGGG